MKEVEHDTQFPEEDAGTEEFNNENPFDYRVAPGVSLIVQMRTYDVLLAILREQNTEAAEKLVQLHAEGKVLGPLPVFDESPDG